MELNERKLTNIDSEKNGNAEKSTGALNVLKSPNYNSINSDSRIDLLNKDGEDEEERSQNFYERNSNSITKSVILLILLAYFIWATYHQVFVLTDMVS